MTLRKFIQSAGLGKTVYQLWHRPVGALQDVIAAGGPLEMRRTRRGRTAMEMAAHSLSLINGTGTPVELHLLTGARFWYQTAFCLWTFAKHSKQLLAPVIYDDGTLKPEHCDPLIRLFPLAKIIHQTEIVARLDKFLPIKRYPALRERWQNYPNIRKLTDVHAGGSGWKLVLDSDLLFFRRPAFLLNWNNCPDRPLHAVDCETAYGYTRTLMNDLAGTAVADLVNVGLTGLRSETIDWEKLESWTQTLQSRERTSYYLEQALIAMMMAGRPCAIAPEADYITLPCQPEAYNCNAVMHHYVANSKSSYFQHCWKVALRQ